MSRLRQWFALQPQHLMLVEASLMGLFFIQALRFLVGMVYTRAAGAVTIQALNAVGLPITSSTAPDPATVYNEITFLLYCLLLPLLAVALGRFQALIVIAVALCSAGRALMIIPSNFTQMSAAALAVGGGLLYIALIARHRLTLLPYMFIFGLGFDQLFRAYGNTLDPSWSSTYANVQIILSGATTFISLVALLWYTRRPPAERVNDAGLLPFWGGIGLGALLFLELSFLSLPNAIASRAKVDYAVFVPAVLAATWLPLIPAVRSAMRSFIGIFDGSVRGWLWMLVIVLLVVFGTRFSGIAAGAALVAAQFAAVSMFWWLARPRAEREHALGGLWLIFGMGLFALLATADNFTYEYAYIRDFAGPLTFLNNTIPPLLRGFRGLGLGVILLTVFLAALPMTQTQRRIPWFGGSAVRSFFTLLIVIAGGAAAALAAQPPVVAPATGLDEIRVGTYNIHGGTDEFFTPSLERIAATIQQSGANIVLLQEVESGRLTSFGVDQSLWLARRLQMDRRFYGTVEGLYGLAVLSNMPIAFDDGALLSSIGLQTGLQRVQVVPAPNIVITLYNTWLGYLLDVGDTSIAQQEQDQQRQLNEIFGLIASHHPTGVLGRTILGGTFNNVPDSPLIAQLRAAQFEDPFAGLPLELSATLVRTGVPRARFDYLWLRNLDPLGAVVIDSDASDHRMAVVGIQLTR